MTAADKFIEFVKTLKIPEGPLHGTPWLLCDFQERFIRGALDPDIQVSALSIGRSNGKTMLGAALTLGAVMGVWDNQPKRECILAAKTKEQARIAWNYVLGLIETLPEEEQEQFKIRQAPRLEIEFYGNGGGIIKAIAADGANALGMAPVWCLMDERGFWPDDKGDRLESALLSALGKKNGRACMLSTSASTDSHSFSRWLDEKTPGVYTQEHRAPDGCAPDSLEALKEANPAAAAGVGVSLDWLQAEARRCIARGSSTLSNFRLFNLNQRVADEDRQMLISTDEWLACEVGPDDLPLREGECIIGLDLGGSASMTAAAAYWPSTGRLEAWGAFATDPNLHGRGENDHVGDRYTQMHDRRELLVMGAKTVPVNLFLTAILERLDGANVTAITCDRYRQSEFQESLARMNIRIPVIYRGMGWKDGGEDSERFRKAVFDGHVKSVPSLLLRSAFSDCMVQIDPMLNMKITKARSTGRIDAAAASILAVAEGRRRANQLERGPLRVAWA